MLQLAQHPGESHLSVPGLEAVTHRRSDPRLGLRLAYSVAEGIGVAAKVLNRCQRYGIDAVLDDSVAGGREAGNPLSQCSDEVAECSGRQGSVDPPVPFGQLGAIVLRAQHDFERSATAHKPGKVLSSTSAREQPERGLELAEDGRLKGSKAHIACEHKLAARGAYTPLDLRDRDEAACAEASK
jgi:hypothetical protein